MGENLIAHRGGFDRLILERAGEPEQATQVVDVVAGDALPAAADYCGVIITGAAAMITDRAPWSVRTADWLPSVVDADVPLLGICYGHQMMAEVFGGRVGLNPRGREMGTVDVELTAEAAADALFSVLPNPLRTQATHLEAVLELPSGARLLGRNERDPYQAFALGELAWGVQFHPEFDAEIIRGYIAARADTLRSEGIDAERLGASVDDPSDGSTLLARFIELTASQS